MTGIEMAEHRAAQVFSIYEIEATGELPAEARVIFDPDLTSVYWPLEKGRCRWGFQIRDAAAHEASMGRLEQLIAARAPWCTARPTQIYWSTLGLFESRLTRSFGKRGVWARRGRRAPGTSSRRTQHELGAARSARVGIAHIADPALGGRAVASRPACDRDARNVGIGPRGRPGGARASGRRSVGPAERGANPQPACLPREKSSSRCSSRSASRPRRQSTAPVSARRSANLTSVRGGGRLTPANARWYKRPLFKLEAGNSVWPRRKQNCSTTLSRAIPH